MRKTKIICTLGPAIDDYDKLKKMAGPSVQIIFVFLII